MVDLELEEALRPGVRRPEPDLPAGVRAALGLLDEEESGRPEHAQLLAEMDLQLVGEKAAAEHVAIPEAAVLEHDPAVDPARRRRQRLGVGVETAAQNARLSALVLGSTLTATNLA